MEDSTTSTELDSLLLSMPRDELSLLLTALEAEQTFRTNRNKLASYRPYAKQLEFHAAGKRNTERLFCAGNQLGKTVAGGFEWAMHLTGRYPNWWSGRTFDKPVKLWSGGVTSESTRDNPQRILFGQPQKREEWGTGAIPGDAIKDTTPGRGIPDLLDSALIKWGGGGDVQAQESVLMFKSYEKGREKWQGDTIDGCWFDEEPPADVYSEGVTRTQANNGLVIVTFTPLKGMSEVVSLYLTDAKMSSMIESKKAA